jgi:hypothetical protein
VYSVVSFNELDMAPGKLQASKCQRKTFVY